MNKIQNQIIIIEKTDQGTEPDNLIFDLLRIEQELEVLQDLSDQFHKEINLKNTHITKLQSQLENILKILQEDSHLQQQDKRKITELNQQLSLFRKTNME